MLSKAKNEEIEVILPELKDKVLLISSVSQKIKNTEQTIYTGNKDLPKGSYAISFTATGDSYPTGTWTIKATIGSNTVSKGTGYPPRADYSPKYVTVPIDKLNDGTETITVTHINSSDYSNINNITIKDVYIGIYSIKIPVTSGIKGKPRSLAGISGKSSITIFGLHIDNTRITQDAE